MLNDKLQPRTTMNLKEPKKKKKRVYLQAQPSLPVDLNENGDWRIYTAHLSASGTCIVDPVEMEAVYSMGFFGKGSLSRSFPSFGKRRYGVPPIARNRQWIRRQKWLEELQSLNENNGLEPSEDLERIIGNRLNPNSSTELGNIECNSEARASTSNASTEPETALNQQDNNNSDIESESNSNEPHHKKLKVDNPVTVEKELEVKENKNTAEISEPMNNEKDILVTDDKSKIINEEQKNAPSVKTDESVKIDESHKNTDSVIYEDSVNGDENHKNTDSVICEDSVNADENKKTTDSVICEDPVNADENKKTTDSVICDESLNVDENQKTTDSVICEDSVNVDENHKTTDSVICDGSMKVDENHKNSSSLTCDECLKVDEVVLDSTEDEEICEIVEKGSNNEKDVYFINEEEKSESEYFKYRDTCEIEEESNPYEILVLPDTDSDTENYLANVKSRIEKEGFPINETLHLTFEETFFLMYGLDCLQLIHYDGSVFSISNAWNHFQQQDKNFIQKYVVYHYFRSKGWVVKPGLKFGGDFLLYKQGPPFYHASYIIIIEVVDADTLIRDDVKSMRKVTWKNLIGLERLSETIAKEILFAQILWPSSVSRNGNQMPVDALSEFTVRELLWRRWDPKRKQGFTSSDDEDSDST